MIASTLSLTLTNSLILSFVLKKRKHGMMIVFKRCDKFQHFIIFSKILLGMYNDNYLSLNLFIFYFINFFEIYIYCIYTIYVKSSEILIRLCLIRKTRMRKNHNFTIFIQKSWLCEIFYFLACTKVYSLKIINFLSIMPCRSEICFPS